MDASKSWHAQSPEEVLSRLETTRVGLGSAEAARRLGEHGPNELAAVRPVSAWTLFAEQFKNLLIIVLLVAVGLSIALGHGAESVAIGAIILLAVILGFVQEFRAERALEALREMASPTATVLRDGVETKVAARDVVPGDVLLLHAGDRVAADARVIESVNLQAEEAALTGESVPVEKIAEALPGALVVADRRNTVHAATAITYGRGRAVVVATGSQTELGRIAQMLHSVVTAKTPLQVNLDHVGTVLIRAAVAIVAAIVALGIIRGQPIGEMLIFGIALAVAVVPEALPAVVTISLALGVRRLVRRNALVRRLPAAETLGSVSVICSDKTGTLTRDEMTVRAVHVSGRTIDVTGTGYEPAGEFLDAGVAGPPGSVLKEALSAAVLASDARLERDPAAKSWSIHGDPTEGALVVAAAKAGLHASDLGALLPRIDEIPFTSEAKRMTTIHRGPSGQVAFVKGAPEVVVAACSHVLYDDGERPCDAAERERLLGVARTMGEDALRVLAVARKPDASRADAAGGLTLLALVGMIDPPRPEAKAAIRQCEAAGIKPVMITGDHPTTAQAVARELGLLKTGRVVTGTQLAAMSDAELAASVRDIDVYARVSPADKLRVVTALQGHDAVVAMTGDGVNDAPALKKADIGIAMGITGTDVTKEAAAMTLTDDNFASIVGAVEEGRGIYGNIKKYLMYLLSSNVGEMGLMAGASLWGLPLPLSAVQLLYVNLATDGLPALALAVDPPEDDLMTRPPRHPRRGIFTRPVVTLIAVGGIWSTAINLGLFAWALRSGRPASEAMTMSFVSLVFVQFFKAYSFRSDRRSILHRPFTNRWLNIAIFWELALLALIVTLPVLHAPFGTFSLTASDWAIVALLAATIVPVLEAAKWVVRRGWLGEVE